jgi:hypothetical protein
MIKLNNILKEIEIGIPSSKQDIINWFIKNDENISTLDEISSRSTLNDFLSFYNFTNLDEYIEYQYGDEVSERTEDLKEYIEAYYHKFKPNEISLQMIEEGMFKDSEGEVVKMTNGSIPYKNINLIYIGGGEYYLYCNNF